MNWDAIGAIGELLGALAVVITLGYLALQIRHARNAAGDVNRLSRATGVRDWMAIMIEDNDLLTAWTKSDGSWEPMGELAEELGVTVAEAGKIIWGCQYWWWLHWGQWASTTSKEDIEELRHLISEFYSTPPMITVWRSGFYTNLLDPAFADFVNSAVDEKLRETRSVELASDHSTPP